jgi:hypothetical protein
MSRVKLVYRVEDTHYSIRLLQTLKRCYRLRKAKKPESLYHYRPVQQCGQRWEKEKDELVSIVPA